MDGSLFFTLLRCLVIMRPLQARHWVNPRRELIAFGILILAVVVSVPLLFRLDQVSNSRFLMVTAVMRSFRSRKSRLHIFGHYHNKALWQTQQMRRLSFSHRSNRKASQSSRIAAIIALCITVAFVIFETPEWS